MIILSSIIISFYAIFQILNNDFNGSKGLWIVICMIGFIGPILYLTKGKKLIIKKDYKDVSNISLKGYYLHLIRNLNDKIKHLFIVSISLILIGKIIKYLDFYIFWESEHIGYIILVISIIVFFINDIRERKKVGFKPFGCYFVIFVASSILLAKFVLLITLPNTDAYEAAKIYLKKDFKLITEIGDIQSFTILPTGNISIVDNSGEISGDATITLIVKGTKKYQEKTLSLEKTPAQDWTVIASK